jgi:hypothetical protein
MTICIYENRIMKQSKLYRKREGRQERVINGVDEIKVRYLHIYGWIYHSETPHFVQLTYTYEKNKIETTKEKENENISILKSKLFVFVKSTLLPITLPNFN